MSSKDYREENIRAQRRRSQLSRDLSEVRNLVERTYVHGFIKSHGVYRNNKRIRMGRNSHDSSRSQYTGRS